MSTERAVVEQAAPALTVGELRAFVDLLDGAPDDVEVRVRTRLKGQNADGVTVRQIAARWTT